MKLVTSAKLHHERDTRLSLVCCHIHSSVYFFFLLPLIKFKQTQLLHIYFSVEFFFSPIRYYEQPWCSKNSSKLYSLEIEGWPFKLSPGLRKEHSYAHVGWVTAAQKVRQKCRALSTLWEIFSLLPKLLRCEWNRVASNLTVQNLLPMVMFWLRFSWKLTILTE